MTVLVTFGLLVRIAVISFLLGFLAGVGTACSIEAHPGPQPMSAPTAPATAAPRVGVTSLTGIRLRTHGINTARRDPVTRFPTGRSAPAVTPLPSVTNGQKSHRAPLGQTTTGGGAGTP